MRIEEVFGVKVRLGNIVEVTDVDGTIVHPRPDVVQKIRSNPHCRGDEDFWCAVGQSEERSSILFKRAVPLTDGSDFHPNELGIRLYGNVTFGRGLKPRGWTDETNMGRYEWLWQCLRESGLLYIS
jgi:hypothetical protein